MIPDIKLVTIHAPPPHQPPLTVDGERYVMINECVYPESVIRAAAPHMAGTPINLIALGKHDDEVTRGALVVRVGTIQHSYYDESRCAIVGLVKLTAAGRRRLGHRLAEGDTIGLSWCARVNYRVAAGHALKLVTNIVNVECIDIHNDPAGGARFGLTPKYRR